MDQEDDLLSTAGESGRVEKRTDIPETTTKAETAVQETLEKRGRRLLRRSRRDVRASIDTAMTLRRIEEPAQLHDDTMLTWLIGLMGAALFALPSLLNASGCVSRSPMWRVMLPWLVGILLALVARVVGRLYRGADARHAVARVIELEALVRNEDIRSIIDLIPRWARIWGSKSEDLARRKRLAARLGQGFSVLLYLSVGAFGVGAVMAFLALVTCLPTAPIHK